MTTSTSCNDCEGKGTVPCLWCGMSDDDLRTECFRCDPGGGRVECEACDGTGQMEVERVNDTPAPTASDVDPDGEKRIRVFVELPYSAAIDFVRDEDGEWDIDDWHLAYDGQRTDERGGRGCPAGRKCPAEITDADIDGLEGEARQELADELRRRLS